MSMSKENTFPNLSAWCEKYHKDNGIKIHPSSVPTDLVLEDVIGFVTHLRANVMVIIASLDNLDVRIKHIEEDIELVKARMEELKSNKKVKQ